MADDHFGDAVDAKAREIRQQCNHTWTRVGTKLETPTRLHVLFVCQTCQSWTYREYGFVGYYLGSLEQQLADGDAFHEVPSE